VGESEEIGLRKKREEKMLQRQNRERFSGISRSIQYLILKGASEKDALVMLGNFTKNCPESVVLLAQMKDDEERTVAMHM